ncbi:DNA topoisomerase 2-binding protein 1-A isoform X4 [Vigna radiata var. radiata]|uniref:DNA topoisomerase 2-binding protein 1-A isoform X4 n=1 Tax=Vigna radiata var. radiata TaxID=3916 RepID=A0A1S3U9K2_VIGRR|nr:DNA topoisomerase 2-binding protein 1-A isoform X4 [Vigna radiata var. radiata]
MLKTKTLKMKAFQGANVFMSRNLVPPEVFDALHDAVKDNGAQLHLCCDPSRNGPDDYHIIASSKHEKFDDLKSKGCKLLGPRCVLSCAKGGRPLPKQGFTCCLAMDGVKVLASGFDTEEKVKIEELVAEMGGVLHTKTSLDLNFVIVKNVLARKYKWALNELKKPIVTYEWLKQCSEEHRVVPQESYKVLPFSGLKICVTGIPADVRKEMEKLILQNGGKYSAELTKNCTHLISEAPQGDKYKVAKRWGHIHIVIKKWFDQSIARRACLNEEFFPVQHGSVSSHKVTRDLTMQHSQEKDIGKLQSAASSDSQTRIFAKEADAEPPLQTSGELNLDNIVADDSESDDNDLYLSECRILLVGFEALEMRKLINIVRKGGGSRYMSFNDKLTHIVVGNPTEMEKKDVRSLAALGVIYVVKTSWLEDCDHKKKEVPVLRRHIAYDLLQPKASLVKAVTESTSMDHSKSSSCHQSSHQVDFENVKPESLEKRKEQIKDMDINGHSFRKANCRTMLQNQLPDNKLSTQGMSQHDFSVQYEKSANVFRGKLFCFSNLFPEEKRGEIVQWISQGGGEVISGQAEQIVHYTVECHGVTPMLTGDSKSLSVSSHWIRSCLEAGSLLDVGSHILYSPLPCHVPLPGFERFRFCVSQYEEKDRNLLRNLCFVLGAKFGEKLHKKVTHLLCKFTNGPKYDGARKWGIQSVTCEWIFECVKQNGVVAVDQFLPKEVTAQDREAGLCTVSQFPTQAAQMISDMPSQLSSQSQILRGITDKNVGCGVGNHETNFKKPSVYSKKARLVEEPCLSNKMPSASNSGIHAYGKNFSEDNTLIDGGEVCRTVPDVAAAIEDLLEQTSKMHGQRSPAHTGCERGIYPSDLSVLGEDNSNPHTVFGLSKHWLNSTESIYSYRNDRKEDDGEASQDRPAGIYDGFSETQTESQVVSYEEDLSGRQSLIDKYRTRSSTQ